MSGARLFRYGCIAFILGIAAASFAPPAWLRFAVGWFALALAGITVGAVLRGHAKKYVPWCVFFIVLGMALAGVWRYALAGGPRSAGHIAYYNGTEVTFVGSVALEADRRQTSQLVRVQARRMVRPVARQARGLVQVVVPRYPEYHYGDVLQFSCELRQPEPLAEFAYDRYLARYGVYSTCAYPAVRAVPADTSGSLAVRVLLFVKRAVSAAIDRGLPEPHASVVQALVLGYRGRVPDDVQNTFARAGISHIVAISGMHLAIVAGVVMYMLLLLGMWRQYALWLGLGMVWLYSIAIGLPASAVRAGVMASVVVVAVSAGRPHALLRALLYAAVAVLAVNPLLLRDDVGFQLSFLAVAGIALAQPLWAYWREAVSRRLPPGTYRRRCALGVSGMVYVTLAAQILTLPVIVRQFGIISAGSVVANVAVAWLVPMSMIGSGMAIVLSLAVPQLAWLWFAPVRLCMDYIMAVATAVEHIPGFVYEGVHAPWWAIGMYYFVVLYVLWYVKKKVYF